MFSVISVPPCEIVSLQLKLDSFVKMGVPQGILAHMGYNRVSSTKNRRWDCLSRE